MYSRPPIRNKLILMPAENSHYVSPAKSKHNWTEANLFLSFLPFCPALCWCVWGVVSGLEPIPLPWACVPTHTPGASTHTPGAHARTAGTDAVNWTLGAQRSQAEWSLAQLEPEDVNRDRASASGQAQQRQTGLQEKRWGHDAHVLLFETVSRKLFLTTRAVSVNTLNRLKGRDKRVILKLCQSCAAILSLRRILSQAAVAVSCFLVDRQQYTSEWLVFSSSRHEDRYHSLNCARNNREETGRVRLPLISLA